MKIAVMIFVMMVTMMLMTIMTMIMMTLFFDTFFQPPFKSFLNDSVCCQARTPLVLNSHAPICLSPHWIPRYAKIKPSF